MKRRLLEHLVCPACFAGLTPGQLHEVGGEIMEGRLVCARCGRGFDIVDGVPQMLLETLDRDVKKARTATSFGFLWSRTTDANTHGGSHAAKTLVALSLTPPAGLVLDAGCGDGSDAAALAVHATEVIGVELSEGGSRAAFERTRGLPNAHIVRADLCHLPFRPAHFTFIYSYGVLHHMPVPAAGLAELARVSSVPGKAAIYLYEDFGERPTLLRWSLRAANACRAITTRLPPPVLYALCVAAAPVVYLGFTVPFKALNRVPIFRPLAAGVPFRHGRTPFGLTADLYDRFSAPIEFRYSRHAAARLARDAGFEVEQVQYERGWMLALRRQRMS